VLGLVIKFALMGTLLAAPITPSVITCAFARGGAEPWFAGGDIVGALLGLAPPPSSHVRRQATRERNFHPSHKAQQITASLKPHEAQQKTLLDQADPRPRGNDVPTAAAPSADRVADAVQAAPAPASIIEREAGQTVGMKSNQAPNPRPGGNDVPIAGGPPPDRVPDAVQAAPVPESNIEREAEQTVGMESVIRDAALNTLPPVIESKGTPLTRSLDALSVVMVVVVALGLIGFPFRRRYAKRDLTFGAVPRLQRPPDYVRPVDLPLPPRNQVEADPEAAVKKILDTIAEG
jgi:hypothetical protein